MYVKCLKMQNFRGISDLTLDFESNQPTVFIGINGVGKSSILDCLAILFSRLLARIQHEPLANKSVIARLRKQKDLANGKHFNDRDLKNNSQSSYNKIEILLSDSQSLTWSLEISREGRDLIRKFDTAQLNEYADRVREQYHKKLKENIPLTVYYSIHRYVLKVDLEFQEGTISRQIDAYENSLTKNNVNFASFFQWFRLIEDLENEERRDDIEYRDRKLEAVRKAIYSMLGEQQFSKLRVRRSPLRMTIEKQGQELSVNQLSDGEKGLLAMVGDLARRLAIANPGLDDPLQGSAVVLIDEIEQHLHPAWQRRVIPNLTKTFPNCQFIVTTHSPQVISQVQPESIYILQNVDDNIIAKRPESSFGRDSNRILEDLMGVAERPQEIKDRLLELFRVIDAGDIEQAKTIRRELARDIGEDEPEFVRADILMRRREILNR